MRVILASASPRRKELLKKLFTDFEVVCATGSETYTASRPSDIVQELSRQKRKKWNEDYLAHAGRRKTPIRTI
ncbi:MAG: Maf family protein [Eubacterium sp.]|nr:Maf family protein [Eubacterium sp.]